MLVSLVCACVRECIVWFVCAGCVLRFRLCLVSFSSCFVVFVVLCSRFGFVVLLSESIIVAISK